VITRGSQTLWKHERVPQVPYIDALAVQFHFMAACGTRKVHGRALCCTRRIFIGICDGNRALHGAALCPGGDASLGYWPIRREQARGWKPNIKSTDADGPLFPIVNPHIAYFILSLASSFAVGRTRAQDNHVAIALAQILCLDGDREGNFLRIENAISEAKGKGAQIVTLPESCILGWENPAAHFRADPIPGKDSDRLCGLARKYGVYLNIGLDEKDGANLYDSCVLIDDNGQIILKHRKINVLPELMTPPYSVGRDIRAVDTKYGRIGVLICADSAVEELLNAMKAENPDILIIPYGWAAREEEWPNHGETLRDVVKNAARPTNCVVVGTDLVGVITNGPWNGRVYGGQSLAVDRSGRVLAQCRDRDKDVTVIFIGVRTSNQHLGPK
jgi:predicted amidohydrolase